MQPAGGHHCAKIYGKMVPLSFYHRVSARRSGQKKCIDTEAQKLLRPVLESAAQGLSRTISCVMIQVHSKIPIYHYLAPPSRYMHILKYVDD